LDRAVGQVGYRHGSGSPSECLGRPSPGSPAQGPTGSL
jgi:hypothetical protein